MQPSFKRFLLYFNKKIVHLFFEALFFSIQLLIQMAWQISLFTGLHNLFYILSTIFLIKFCINAEFMEVKR